jgi:hypothetical protein
MMHLGLVKAVVTLGVVAVCLGTAYSVRFVVSEVSFLHSKLQTRAEFYSDLHWTTWRTEGASLDDVIDISPDAVRDVLGVQPHTTSTVNPFVAQ